MSSAYTGISLANSDHAGTYKKTRRLWNNTAGFDASNGGVFVKLSGAGVVQAAGSADIYGIIFDAVASAAGSGDAGYVDVYNGLQDKFMAKVTVGTVSGSSALVNGANVYARDAGAGLGLAVAGLDIVGTIENSTVALSDGGRVVFSLTPSEAIAGYDSGNTT